ncbi:UDP-glucuronic acid decarboxylase family protein [Roseibium sp. MMSF_3544]|uniref:UDP-glucuronic acid decarboxylase family protein n=1 Tax=unclassified Roseibium TaxID=2629323 RepID=UPI00273E2979|nr:UDP-glucuronic acid decarboxylase family protein [Roseibium sp. MMSF_3544]
MRTEQTFDESITGAPGKSSPIYRKKKALVTGGAGFLGSHLCKRLLDEGYQVICLDNFSTGQFSNIDDLTTHADFQLVVQDIEKTLDGVGDELDEIYNLACPASPPHYQLDPVRTMKTNVMGAVSVLDLACRTGATAFQASTSEVYGDPLVHPQPESYFGNVNPTGPRACYDEGKRAAETLFFDYARTRAVPIKVVRIFNTYGPNMRPDDGRVVSNFIIQALRGEDITIYGTGNQTRSFCYVDDLIEGFRRFMMTPDNALGPMNLGNPGEFTILELAEKVIEKTGSPSKLVFLEKPKDDPQQRKPDISQASQELGWKPEISLDKGLDFTIAHFDNVLSKADAGPFVEAAE